MRSPPCFVGRTRFYTSSSQKQRKRDEEAILKSKPADQEKFDTGANFIDPDEERDPPPKATPVNFPSVKPPVSRSWDDETPPPDLQALFTRVLKPSSVSSIHLEALNIDLREECSPADLIPKILNGASYIPPHGHDEAQDEPAISATRGDAGQERKRKDFESRLAELRVDNVTAYRVITRSQPPGGTQLPRIAGMRAFWQAAESMSQYWDCTLDQEYAVSKTSDSDDNSAKRQKLETSSEATESSDATAGANDSSPGQSATADSTENGDTKTGHHHTASDTPDTTTAADPAQARPRKPFQLRPRIRYKGFRTNTGRAMPDQFRVDTVKGFVEGTVWPFQCNVYPPRMMPLLHINKLKLPIRQSFGVYRLPKDRDRARAGGLVGPVLGVQVRSENDFEGDEDKARLDVMREIGGLLHLAQERAREGKTEVKPGEGKWWTTVPRWGGGPGGEMENEEGNSDVVALAAEQIAASKEQKGADAKRKRQPKKTPAMLWKELKCGSGYFDPKTEYAAIGKDPAADVDEVFLVSSLNHHVSILKLTVHRAYVEYLTSATLPAPFPADPEWCRPVLQRTKWYDLFDKEERVEAFRGLWGVIAYLTRETGGKGDVKTGEDKA